MATTSVDANAFEGFAVRDAPMDITWTIHDAGADANTLCLVAKVVMVIDTTLIATVIIPNMLVITITRLKAVIGVAIIMDDGQLQ